jgi:hypothetical protein
VTATTRGFHAITWNRNTNDRFACRWLRAPATTENRPPGSAQAVEHFCPLRGTRGSIEALPCLFHLRYHAGTVMRYVRYHRRSLW